MGNKIGKTLAPELLAHGVRFGRDFRLNGNCSIEPSEKRAGVIKCGRIPSKLDYRLAAQLIRNEHRAVRSNTNVMVASVLLLLADVARELRFRVRRFGSQIALELYKCAAKQGVCATAHLRQRLLEADLIAARPQPINKQPIDKSSYLLVPWSATKFNDNLLLAVLI